MNKRRSSSSELRLPLVAFCAIYFLSLACVPTLSLSLLAAAGDSDSDQLDDTNVDAKNVSRSRAREDSFAGMIDRALEKEFTEGDQIEGSS